MEKTNEGRAVADPATKSNFTLRMQRVIERQGVSDPGAIVGHARSVKLQPRIAAKRVAADLTAALSAGKVRSGAVDEVESRTNVGAGVSSNVIPLVQPGFEVNGCAAPLIVTLSSQSDPGSSALFMTLNTEAIKQRAIGFVAVVESHDGSVGR